MNKKILFTFVIFFHIVGITFFSLKGTKPEKKRPRIQVEHVVFREEKKSAPIPAKAPPQKSAPTKKAPAPTPVKKSTPAKKKSPAPKKERAKVPEKLLKELEQNIAKIEKEKEKVTFSSKKEIAPRITLESFSAEEDRDYAEKLVGLLQERLRLPERGEVTLSIEIGNGGVVKCVKVQSSENRENETYLRNAIETMLLPPPKVEKSYTITFYPM